MIKDVNGNCVTNQQEISACFPNFYSNLFQSQKNAQNGLQAQEIHDIRTNSLSEDSKYLLSSLIKELEIKEAIFFPMQSSKATKPDGFLHFFTNNIGIV